MNSGIEYEEWFRSAEIILAPQDLALQSVVPTNRQDADHTADTISRACWLLQAARATAYTIIKDSEQRDTTIAAMTPVDFTAVYSTRNGKPHIEALLVNDCNLAIRGNISVTLPAGWKTTAKSTAFRVSAGDRFALSFDLVPDSAGAAAPAELPPMAVNITITQDMYKASYRLKPNAKPVVAPAAKPSPKPVVPPAARPPAPRATPGPVPAPRVLNR